MAATARADWLAAFPRPAPMPTLVARRASSRATIYLCATNVYIDDVCVSFMLVYQHAGASLAH
ncbi:hypothetical protein C0Z17_18875 [Trinickia caryophylli]|nr:hypothetical protein C0Z17_18875 [Trinickia caryophylli]